MPAKDNYKILGLSSSLTALSISVLMHVGIVFILMVINNTNHQVEEEIFTVELVFHEVNGQPEGSNYEIKKAERVAKKIKVGTKKVTTKKEQIYRSTKEAAVDKTENQDIKVDVLDIESLSYKKETTTVAAYEQNTPLYVKEANIIAADEPNIQNGEQLFLDNGDNILHIDDASGGLSEENSIEERLTSVFHEDGDGAKGVGDSTISNNGKGAIESVFGFADGPSFLKMVKPKYPRLARRLGKEGRVVLRLFIDEDGKLINVEIIKSAGYGFDEAAIDAIKASTFNPAKMRGTPIASKAVLPIRFRLE